MKALSLEGKRFGRLVVLRRAENNSYGKATWLCQCDCGNSKTVIASKLMIGETTSCGCKRIDIGKANRKHGGSLTALYNRYGSMIQRCHNPNNSSYPRYGGKGITVCERWRNSFEAFRSDMGDPPNGYTLDRIDNSKGYSPDNCRWASPKQQAENSSRPLELTFNGETMNLSDWARKLGIKQATLSERLKKWPIEDALGCRKSHRFVRRKI